MNKQNLTYFKECSLISLGKTTKLEEATKEHRLLVESSDGKQYEALAVIRDVPISKYTENKNGRIYPRPLWEKIYKEKSAERTLCLADHPEGDNGGSVNNIAGVWHNLKLGEHIVSCDLYLTEEKFLKVLKAGGKIGTSSSGWGSLMEDGKTVNPTDYILERTSDLVLDPSQGTFMEYAEESSEEMIESINKEEGSKQFIEKVDTNKKEDNFKLEEKRGNNMLDKMLEGVYKNQVKAFLAECGKRTDYKTLLNELDEAVKSVPSELADVVSQYDNMKKHISEKIEQELKESKTKVEESEQELLTLTEKYDLASRQVDELKEKLQKANALIESFKKDEKEPMFENMSDDEALKVLSENVKVYEKDIDALIKDRKLMEADLKKLKSKDKQLAYAEKTIKQYESILTKMGYKFVEEGEEDEKKDDEEKEDEEEMKEEFEDEIIEPEFIEEPFIDEPIMVDDPLMDDDFSDDLYEETEDEKEDEEKEDEEEMEEETEDDEDDKEDEDEEEMKEKCKKSSKKLVKKVKESAISPVKNFYKEAVIEFPKAKRIEKEILSCKSLMEAVNLLQKFKKYDSDQKPFKINESTSVNSSKSVSYKFPGFQK